MRTTNMKKLLTTAMLVSGCGTVGDKPLLPMNRDPEIVIITPKPKGIEVGQHAKYIVDPKRSSNLVSSGVMNVEVSAKDDKFTTIYGSAAVQTVIGAKTFSLTNKIENELLTPEFMANLRGKKTHQATEFSIQWIELTADACDVIELTNIKGMDDAVLRPTICIGSRTIPSLKVTVKSNGMTVPVTFVPVE